MKRLVEPTSQRSYRLGDRPTAVSTNNAHILFELRKVLQKPPVIEVSIPSAKGKQEGDSEMQPLIIPMGNPSPKYSEATVKQYERSEEIKQYILNLANGICECCEQQAPFITDDGKPYLEVHHLQPLALGGPDTPENTVAICPNCHRELHFGRDRGQTLQNLCKRVKRTKMPTVF
ncbi:MAG: HNH endonuclease, partial [Candidatus Cloacimonetes bacterium]|nr:HNH endonuclease [Candidatus Cloacimonadota bacterium]